MILIWIASHLGFKFELFEFWKELVLFLTIYFSSHIAHLVVVHNDRGKLILAILLRFLAAIFSILFALLISSSWVMSGLDRSIVFAVSGVTAVAVYQPLFSFQMALDLRKMRLVSGRLSPRRVITQKTKGGLALLLFAIIIFLLWPYVNGWLGSDRGGALVVVSAFFGLVVFHLWPMAAFLFIKNSIDRRAAIEKFALTGNSLIGWLILDTIFWALSFLGITWFYNQFLS